MNLRISILFIFLLSIATSASFADQKTAEVPVVAVEVFFVTGQGLDWPIGDIDTAFNQTKTLIDQNIPTDIKAKVVDSEKACFRQKLFEN